MTNVLTAAEAANFIRSTTGDAIMLQYLPLIDQYLLNASGHDWAADSTIHPTAKLAAGMLLCYWYDNPGALGQSPETVNSQLVQLEAEACKYRKYEFEGLSGAGAIPLPGAREGDTVVKLVAVYGSSGSKTSSFEAVISEPNQIVQLSGDLSDVGLAVVLKSPADDVSA